MSINTQSKSVDPRRYRNASTFFDYLKLALDDYQNPEALGQLSPLTTPYFLGRALINEPTAETDMGRGQVLCREIDHAMESLWGDTLPADVDALFQGAAPDEAQKGSNDRYHYLILELTYFKRYFAIGPKTHADIYDDILHISRATYHRHLREATETLCKALLLHLNPSFSPEQPILYTDLIGRAHLLERCLKTLQDGKSISLCGAGGVGKTSLGVAIREQWSSSAVLWFTIRPTLNDQPDSFLFSLGHFLHQQGASGLWLQLIADRGEIKDLNLALGLVRADLAQIDAKPLLCLDEIDLIRPADSDLEVPKHTQMAELIEDLENHVPILAIGQRAVLATDVTHTLNGLTDKEIQSWITALNIAVTEQEVEKVCHFTEGNPRLLELLIALYQADESTYNSLVDVLDDLPQTPALSPIWVRLQRRLSKHQCYILQALSVFRRPSSKEAWQSSLFNIHAKKSADEPDTSSLTQLIKYRLIQEDGRGGVMLLPALRGVIYNQLSIEYREQLHIDAAQIRSASGEYTAIAYHYWRGGQPEQAIKTWYPHREQEIQRGQAGAALTIFEEISVNRISPKAGKELTLLRSELHQLHGEVGKTLQELDRIEWSTDEEISVDALHIWGDALADQGNMDLAKNKYAEGIETTARLLKKQTHLHVRRSWAYLDQREMQPAWKEANLASYHVGHLQGTLHDLQGNYASAHTQYSDALKIAKDVDDTLRIARSYHSLGILASHQGKFEEGVQHLEQSISYYEQIGDRISQEELRTNLAPTYIELGQVQSGIQMAKQALTFFEHMGNTAWIAMNANNLSYTYYELGEFDLAKHYAELCLDQEDPFNYPHALFTLGSVKQAQGAFVDAEAHFSRSKQIAEQNEDPALVAHAMRALGEIHLAQHRNEPARQALNEAHRLFRQLDIPHEIEKTEALLNRDLDM